MSTAPGLEAVTDLLSQVLRVSSAPTHGSPMPTINVTPSSIQTVHKLHSSGARAISPSFTASDSANTQSALLPLLIHLAAGRGDVEGLKYCIDLDDRLFSAMANPSPEGASALGTSNNVTSITTTVPGGVVNCLDGSTRMSPLHVAAINGYEKAVKFLLRSGALVHQRDILDHTSLYYVRNITMCGS